MGRILLAALVGFVLHLSGNVTKKPAPNIQKTAAAATIEEFDPLRPDFTCTLHKLTVDCWINFPEDPLEDVDGKSIIFAYVGMKGAADYARHTDKPEWVVGRFKSGAAYSIGLTDALYCLFTDGTVESIDCMKQRMERGEAI